MQLKQASPAPCKRAIPAQISPYEHYLETLRSHLKAGYCFKGSQTEKRM